MAKYGSYPFNTSIRCRFFGLLCGLLILLPVPFAAASPPVRIGVVMDGPWEGNAGILRLFHEEINDLLGHEFSIQFPERANLTADWTPLAVHRCIDRLLSDPQVDIVLAIGMLAGQDLARRGPLPKPGLALLTTDRSAQRLPASNGSSGVHNFTYIAPATSLLRDLQLFQELVPFRHLTILSYRPYHEAIPEIAQTLEKKLAADGIELTVIPLEGRVAPALAALPVTTDAVYITPLLLSAPEFRKLVGTLIERKLPSYSYLGYEEVQQGVLAGSAPATDFSRLARRTALNLQRILLGEDAADLPATINRDERLTVNMATARAIGFSPTWDALIEAEQLYAEPRGAARRWSLESVVREAVAVNLDLAAADRKVAAGLEDIRKARANLLPQLGLSATGLMIDDDRAAASFGTQAERSLSASLELQQSLYSEPAWANFEIQRHQQAGRQEEWRQLRLDVIQEAASGYLNVLRAKTLQTVQKNNLRVTRSNLDLARMRREVGFSSPAEVYRWENQLARDRRALIDADVARTQTEIALNRTLHRPLEEAFATADQGLDDPVLIASDPRLFAQLATPAAFARFRDFMVEQGLRSSPEIKRLDAAIAAQQRARTAARRAFWVPDLSLQAGVTQLLGEDGEGVDSPFNRFKGLLPVDIPEADDTSWHVGLKLSLPLFAGGSRWAELVQAERQIDRLELERKALSARLEQRIRSALQDSRASHAGIRLSREGAQAAAKNLELVTDAYSRGVVSILELLDAQNASLIAEQSAANAVYDFLLDLMAVQRSLGQFDFFLSAGQREQWFQRLELFLQSSPAEYDRIPATE
ncbi:periplasmic substrate-binding protein and efflux pump, RND family, outer membrane protein [Syntrophotalea carbinolica DSM 2380]|uniref:Periplasmic substrate-binding protein and efflux pump, RND family, outer membrane protein n=1 Tax=Syntrophotalea carbinolica (strain DSM 2380 / NBRC 103641 / GraBd1) TaxID=338963 RepID=Q3A069_SYNC1|nr:TolC family protein [Syntrophotalea carbinolica]ABA90238.1 periplasmic substrate-binding protein and efflux pump, RND family, outer membrane protein [Syntrophotalea carbinolica DSM 2380]